MSYVSCICIRGKGGTRALLLDAEMGGVLWYACALLLVSMHSTTQIADRMHTCSVTRSVGLRSTRALLLDVVGRGRRTGGGRMDR